jgi:plasmid stabilization system protein ParE
MRRHSSSRSDLVIGMTLAEVFLLLLIVGWYGSRLESEERGGSSGLPATVPRSELEDAQRRLTEAESRLADAKRKYEQLERILDWIAKTAGLPRPIHSVKDAQEAVDRIRDEAKRGRPACRIDNNILVDVEADAGRVVATVHQEFSHRGTSYTAGQLLRTDAEIHRFLNDVNAYYEARKIDSQSNCVFDFALMWRTDRDYRTSRELFERYFYPSSRIGQLK